MLNLLRMTRVKFITLSCTLLLSWYISWHFAAIGHRQPAVVYVFAYIFGLAFVFFIASLAFSLIHRITK
jgi:hypothetical protein